MTVEFLSFQGCPNCPALRASLDEAIGGSEALAGVLVIEIDLMSLPEGDARLAWGAPTILLDGSDVFGQPAGSDRRVSCRLWPGGVVPSQEHIRERLLEVQQ
jgi:hypothetical protein